MEIMNSNISPSLNSTAVKRMSYIKPPVPPKPKIIPSKPHFRSSSGKLPSTPRKFHSTSNSPSKDETSPFGSESPVVRERNLNPNFTLPKSEEDHNNSVSFPARQAPAPPSIRIYRPSGSSHDLSGSSAGSDSLEDGNAPNDDTPSHLLENGVDINSKSSSDSSSLSIEDSDSDESSKEIHPCFNSHHCDSIPYTPPHSPSPSPSDNDQVTKLNFDHSNEDETKMINNNNDDEIVSKQRRKAFYVAREISTSENAFVATLKLLNEDFKKFLYDKGAVNFCAEGKRSSSGNIRSDAIPEKELDVIFKYLPNLQNLNQAISADLELRILEWEAFPKIADIFVKKGPFLKLYANYIMELEYHTNLLHECAERYSLFGDCLKEFETSGQSNFIPVSRHLLTPMQRITKYKELMKQYFKYLPEDSIDYSDALQALNIVKDVAEHANEAIRELENSARLLCLQERLNGASNPESPLLGLTIAKPQHLLVEPGRKLLKEGQLMKLCRRGVRMVYLILLSDSLLYTTQDLHGSKNCPLKLRYKLPIERMRVKIPKSEDFQNEFTVISTSRSFTIRTSSPKERDAWLSSLHNAIESNARRRISFEKARTADFVVIDSNALGSQAPAWVPDNRVTMCQLCTSEFTLTFRRHHCRACGKVVCRYCSANRAPLAYLDNTAERVCDICFDELQEVVQRMEVKEEEIIDIEEKKRFRRSITTIKGRFSQRGFKDSRIRKSRKPDRLLEVCGGDHSSQICGYLRHFSRKAWRHSWFVLKDKVLYEYRAPEDICALNSLPILGYSVNAEFKSLDIFDGMDPSNAFQLLHSNQQPLIFYAESNDLANKWRKVMKREVDL